MFFIGFILSSGSIADKKDGGIELEGCKSSKTFNDENSGDEDLKKSEAVTVTLHIFVGIVNGVDCTGEILFSEVIERLISDLGSEIGEIFSTELFP